MELRRCWKAEQVQLEARAVEAEAREAAAAAALARIADGGTDGMGPSELRTVGEELHAALGRNTERQALNGVPCLICRDKRAEFGFLHVGRPELGVHHGACEDCATQLQQTADKGKHPPCPICRNACTPIKVHCSM